MEMNQGQEKLPPISILFSQTWSLYKKRFWYSIAMQLLVYLGTILMALAMLGLFGGTALIYSITSSYLYSGIAGFVLAAIFGVAVAVNLSIWGGFVLGLHDTSLNIWTSIKSGWKKAGNLFIVGLLAIVFSFGVSLLLTLLMTVFQSFGQKGILFASVLFFIGLIYLLFKYAFFIAWTVTIDNKTGLSAFKYNGEIIKGRFWSVFGRFVLIWFIALVLGIVLSVIQLRFSGLPLTPNALMDPNTVDVVGTIDRVIGLNIISMIINLVINPFLIAYIYRIYQQLKGE